MIAHSVADQLRLIDRAVMTLTRSTEALLRASDEESLLDDICHIAVDIAGYKLAWIGFARPDELKSVTAVAQAGSAEDYVRHIRVSWADTELGRGPVGSAIRTGMTQVIRDTRTDPRFSPWHDAAIEHGFRSVISLPLGKGDGCLGALAIYASEPDAFDDDVIRLLEDVASNLTYGIGALRMKVEHEQAVRDLAESEERYRSLVELTPDPILVHSQGTILFANPASASAFGASSPEHLVGRPVIDFVEPEARADFLAMMDKASAQSVTEIRLLRVSGMPFDAEVVTTTITFHGLPARLLVVRDLTERKQVQEQLIQSAKLATLGEMAAGLVHELSQPLNIMRLTAEGALLFIERGKATPEWQAQQFQLIADQAERTAEIIDDIRIFSRRDSSPVQVFDAITAVRSAIGVLEGQMRPDGVELDLDLPASSMLVRGRRVQLEQVMMNLAANAHHAVKEIRDGCPQDWVPRIRVAARRNGRWLVLTVADNGPGMPPHVRARIFEPFFTTKEAGRGTGLGLSVSFGIVHAMGGRLEAADLPEGACFTVTLPLDEDATLAAGESEDHGLPPTAQSDAHIMVVDDETTAAEALSGSLREMGYRVTLCASGTAAYDQFMRDPADVVITDLRMPAGTGEQLIEKLRDFDPLLPIVIVTGHLGATERLSESLRDDRCAVLKKPVALGRLGELIATFLQPPPE